MVAEFKLLVSCPDRDENEPVEAILRVLHGMLAISVYLKHKRGGAWLTRRFRLFRGPWPLQIVLTPLFAFNGILFSKRQMSWIDLDTSNYRLRITPFVPAEFWVDIRFNTREEADAVARLIGAWSLGPPQHGRLLELIHRWPEAFASPLFLIPMAIGVIAHDEFWIAIGIGVFVAYIVVGMVLTGRQHAKEQRQLHSGPPADSVE